jgi:hypothetical protein
MIIGLTGLAVQPAEKILELTVGGLKVALVAFDELVVEFYGVT